MLYSSRRSMVRCFSPCVALILDGCACTNGGGVETDDNKFRFLSIILLPELKSFPPRIGNIGTPVPNL